MISAKEVNMSEKNEKTTLSVVITKEMRNAIDRIAKEEDRKISSIVRIALMEYIAKRG